MLSLEECEPNRPPRSQNAPLASGTVKLEIIIGRFSIVTSANQAIGIAFIGKVVWAPLKADIGIRETSGRRRLSAVGSFGPLISFSRSTICRKPPLLVPL